ncbi:MAG: VOC family protein [Pseudomonadota bacterium]
MRLGAMAYIVRDYDEAIGWFTDKLGFSLKEDTELSAQKRWVVVSPPGGGADLVLARAAKPEQQDRIGDQTGGRVFLFLYTDDFDRDFARLTVKGVQFLENPRAEAYGKVAVFEDLYANKWDLVERRG